MKRVFQIIGVMFSILLIYFFLQYSNYVIFPMSTGTFFDCSVEKAITSGELSEISKENNITAFTITYNNTSFFKREIDFRFLNVNPDDRICFGVQKSLLPSTQVQYTEYGNEVSHIQKFWVLNSEDADFTGFIDQLKNHVPKYEQFDPVEFNLLSMLDLRNLYFFGCVFLTLTACNFIWFCIQDEKKTMLKRCSNQFFNEIIPYFLISGAFGIYILFANSSLLLDFIRAFAAFGIVLLAIHIAGAGLTFIIVRAIRCSSMADKAKRCFSIAILLAFTLIAGCIFAISSQSTYFNIMNYAMFKQGAHILEGLSPAYITTAKIPDKVSIADSFPDAFSVAFVLNL